MTHQDQNIKNYISIVNASSSRAAADFSVRSKPHASCSALSETWEVYRCSVPPTVHRARVAESPSEEPPMVPPTHWLPPTPQTPPTTPSTAPPLYQSQPASMQNLPLLPQDDGGGEKREREDTQEDYTSITYSLFGNVSYLQEFLILKHFYKHINLNFTFTMSYKAHVANT